MNKRIIASEKSLAFDGMTEDALCLIFELQEVYEIAGRDMPKMLNDFVFNMEVACQRAGALDADFGLITATDRETDAL